jgi:uncharacterized protein YgfB (UPF0149 family)
MALERAVNIGTGILQVNGAAPLKTPPVSLLDSHPADGSSVSFDEVANALLEQGQLLSPSELHGCLCGLLGGGFDGDDSALIAQVEQTLDTSVHGSLADAVSTLRGDAMAAVTDGDLDFTLLLPGEDLELEQRIASMATWCRGFLSGFAQARVSTDAAGEVVATDSAEALRDFAAIAQAASDDNESAEDEREGHYYELLEYLRVAAMNVIIDALPEPGTERA